MRRTLSGISVGDFSGRWRWIRTALGGGDGVTEAEVYFVPREVVGGFFAAHRPRRQSDAEFSLRLREFNRHYIREVLESERLSLVGRFARSIVHDFKNPLNIIGIAADLAAMEDAPLETRTMACNRIRRQIDRLTSMINELLEFTRGSDNAAVLAKTNYREFVRRILDETRVEMGVSSISLECENEAPDLSVLIDPVRLSHLFTI